MNWLTTEDDRPSHCCDYCFHTFARKELSTKHYEKVVWSHMDSDTSYERNDGSLKSKNATVDMSIRSLIL